MKPGIPEIGTVIRLEGGNAVVRMKSDGSCGKCGVAAAGLCTGGLMKVLTARNPSSARVGDTVKIGLATRIKFTGYVLAYVVPSLALILGSVGGYYLGGSLGLPSLDIILGMVSLVSVSFISFRRLKRLDSSSSIEVVSVLYDPWDPVSARPDASTVRDHTYTSP